MRRWLTSMMFDLSKSNSTWMALTQCFSCSSNCLVAMWFASSVLKFPIVIWWLCFSCSKIPSTVVHLASISLILFAVAMCWLVSSVNRTFKHQKLMYHVKRPLLIFCCCTIYNKFTLRKLIELQAWRLCQFLSWTIEQNNIFRCISSYKTRGYYFFNCLLFKGYST